MKEKNSTNNIEDPGELSYIRLKIKIKLCGPKTVFAC